MKNIVKKWVWLFVCSLLLVSGISVSAGELGAQNQTVYKPFVEVTNITVNGGNFKPGDTLKYSLTITDIDMEARFGCEDPYPVIKITWQGEQGQELKRYFAWPNAVWNSNIDLENTICTQMKIKDSIKITKGMQPGKWKVARIELIKEWEGINFEDDDSLYIYPGDKPADENHMYMDLSAFEIHVSGSVTDSEPPTINKKSLRLQKSKLKRGEKTVFQVKVTDKSPIRYVICTWNYTLNKKKPEDNWDTDYRMIYKKKKKVYECYLSAGEKNSVEKLISITVCDIFGNKTYYVGKKSGSARLVKKKYRCDFSKMKVYTK